VVTTRATRLILLLRVAYITGAALFLIDVLIGLSAGTLEDVGTLPHSSADTPVDIAMDWIAIVAFCCAAVGAVVTVFASSEVVRTSREAGEPH
jgi:hypothetical protein